LSARWDGALTIVRGDARLLRRVVRNMLENAVRYSGSSASVEAIIGTVGNRACVDVLDRGPGVPVAERERIFEPFYRARGASERSGGVGLDLSLARQIAHEYKGTLECLPRDGGGGHFRLTLPT
jgi:signal transduction histidine kinase